MANYSTVAAIFNNPNVLSKRFEDAITTQNSLVWWLLGKPVDSGAGMKPTAKSFTREVDGGSRFEVPVMLLENSNIKAYAKDDTFTVTANNVGDRAYYDIKSLGGPVPIYGFDKDVSASNKTNLINLTSAIVEQAEMTLANNFSAQFLRAAGTGGANDWASLYDMIATDPTADSIGGISSATYPKWRNQYKDATGESIATYLLSHLTNYKVKATYGVQKPNLVVTTHDLYGKLMGQLVALQRFQPDTELAKAGFEGLNYNGMSIMFDENATAGSILLINANGGLELGKLKGAWLEVEEPIRIYNMDAYTMFIRARGNLIMKNRRTNGVIFNFTTA